MAKKDEADSVDLENPAYIGVSPEYKNAANESDVPKFAEPDDDVDEEIVEVEKAASEREQENAEKAKDVGFRGYAPDAVHPSEAVTPSSERLERNRLVEEAAAKDAREKLEGSSGGSDEGGDTPFPS